MRKKFRRGTEMSEESDRHGRRREENTGIEGGKGTRSEGEGKGGIIVEPCQHREVSCLIPPLSYDSLSTVISCS